MLPTTIPRRPGRRGQADGRPIRTHSPRIVTRAPAGIGLATLSTRTTNRGTKQSRDSPVSRTFALVRVSRLDPPGLALSLATPCTRTPSPVLRSPAQDAPARFPAAEPRRAPAMRPPRRAERTRTAGRPRRACGKRPKSQAEATTPEISDPAAASEDGEGTAGNLRPRAIPRVVASARRSRGGTRRGLAPTLGVRAPRTRRPARHGIGGASCGS